jgi:ABC-type lipoprotein export system ATPase subunit
MTNDFGQASTAPTPEGWPGAGGTPAQADAAARPVIALNEVRKIYGEGENAVEALRGVDFTAMPDRMTAIVGPSGSGKSTLLNMIGGLDTPTSGRIEFGGRELTRLSEADRTKFRARNIGFVFQFLNLLPGLTCQQNVMLGGVIVGMAPGEARSRADELLEIVGLGDKRKQPARKLSGGQMQRVAIARALINDAQLLLADEPTGNLDEKNAEEITALLASRATGGRAVVLVTHNNDLAERFADDIKVVRDGQIHVQKAAEIHEVHPPVTAPEPTAPRTSAPDASLATPTPAAPTRGNPLTVGLDPAVDGEQLIATIAMSLASQGASVRFRQGVGGKVELVIDAE